MTSYGQCLCLTVLMSWRRQVPPGSLSHRAAGGDGLGVDGHVPVAVQRQHPAEVTAGDDTYRGGGATAGTATGDPPLLALDSLVHSIHYNSLVTLVTGILLNLLISQMKQWPFIR
jgi:hypothetical protein